MIWLVPIGTGHEEVVLTAPISHALHLYLPAGPFNLLADQYNLARSPIHSIPYKGGLHDELIRQLGLAILSEMTEESATGRMFAETSSLMLAARLAHTYADGSLLQPGTNDASRLDNARLRRVLDYIDQHLEQEITVAGLASLANLSAFTSPACSRLPSVFRRTGMSAAGGSIMRWPCWRPASCPWAKSRTGRVSRRRLASPRAFRRGDRHDAGGIPAPAPLSAPNDHSADRKHGQDDSRHGKDGPRRARP